MTAVEAVLLAMAALIIGYCFGRAHDGPLIIVRVFNRASGANARAG